MKIIKIFIASIFLLFYCTSCYAENPVNTLKRVAHGGGVIQGVSYTNSLEALNYNYEKGFEFFELDFSWTKDEHLVCIHDWSESFEKIFKFKTSEAPPLEAFNFLVKQAAAFQPCTVYDLQLWLEKHPKAKIITDVKENNIKALTTISQTISNYKNRIIPQIYTPNNYFQIRKLGYEKIIWTLYRFDGDDDAVLDHSKNMKDLFAITMPPFRLKTGLARELSKNNIRSYVHSINIVKKLQQSIQQYGATEVYTDFLSPTENKIKSEIPLDKNTTNNGCLAKYNSFDGTLHIPCLLMPDSSSPKSIYEIQMHQHAPKLVFEVDIYKLKNK